MLLFGFIFTLILTGNPVFPYFGFKVIFVVLLVMLVTLIFAGFVGFSNNLVSKYINILICPRARLDMGKDL